MRTTNSDVEMAAYYRWQAAGSPYSEQHPTPFWLEAEQEAVQHVTEQKVVILKMSPAEKTGCAFRDCRCDPAWQEYCTLIGEKPPAPACCNPPSAWKSWLTSLWGHLVGSYRTNKG